MLKYKLKVKGIKPLVWHAFTPDALAIESKPKAGKTGNDPEEWKKTVLIDPDNKLFIHGVYAFASLREGSKNVRFGRGTLKTKLVSCLNILDTMIYIKNRSLPAEDSLTTNPLEPVYLLISGVVNPSTKGRNVRYRIAASKGWEAEFSIMWDDRLISKEQMKQIVEFAGLCSGFGDGRSVGMGRYEMLDFEKVA